MYHSSIETDAIFCFEEKNYVYCDVIMFIFKYSVRGKHSPIIFQIIFL